MKYKTVIFDLDGTLLNTLGDLAYAVNAATNEYGAQYATEDEVRQRVGNGIRKLIERSLPENTSDEIIDNCLAVFRKHYGENMMCRTHPYDGITEMLENLNKAGVQVAVLSNKYDPAAKKLIEHYFSGLVEITMGERENVPRKPDPTSCNELIKLLGADKKTTLYVGDSAVDINTAKAAGLDMACVTWGFRDRDVLQKAGGTLFVDRPYEIEDIILGIDENALKNAFEKKGFSFKYFECATAAKEYLIAQCKGKKIGFGGSVTLEQLGLYDALKQNGEQIIWHWKGDEYCMDADVYITSANGLSKTGEVINIDGRCNRVAATLYGSKKCIFVCGYNKLAPNVEMAIERARNISAPLNAKRLNKNTPCTITGRCEDCTSKDRICRALAVLMSPPMGMESEVVVINEKLGY